MQACADAAAPAKCGAQINFHEPWHRWNFGVGCVQLKLWETKILATFIIRNAYVETVLLKRIIFPANENWNWLETRQMRLNDCYIFRNGWQTQNQREKEHFIRHLVASRGKSLHVLIVHPNIVTNYRRNHFIREFSIVIMWDLPTQCHSALHKAPTLVFYVFIFMFA